MRKASGGITLLLLTALIGYLAGSGLPAGARESSNSEAGVMAMSVVYTSDNKPTLVILDTQKQALLLYGVMDKQLILKEVRSMTMDRMIPPGTVLSQGNKNRFYQDPVTPKQVQRLYRKLQ